MIFLEATTLLLGGHHFHRRTARALERRGNTFVCSTGIAMAYLGILLLAAATRSANAFVYEGRRRSGLDGARSTLKTAFLLILSG